MSAMADRSALRASGLRKSFGRKLVLGEVVPGRICALLGPNGAGKTTTVEILSTLVAEDPVEFAEAFLRNYPEGQWISRERERLTNAIDRVVGNEP